MIEGLGEMGVQFNHAGWDDEIRIFEEARKVAGAGIDVSLEKTFDEATGGFRHFVLARHVQSGFRWAEFADTHHGDLRQAAQAAAVNLANLVGAERE